MRRLCLALCCSVGFLCVAQPAFASVGHTVGPGETLWSIAAANGFTTRALAAANGLSENSNVALGSTIQIPTVTEAAIALRRSGIVVGEPAGDEGGTGSSAVAGSPPPPAGSYVVRPGDTLSGIAARAGVSTSQLAWMNGVSA